MRWGAAAVLALTALAGCGGDGMPSAGTSLPLAPAPAAVARACARAGADASFPVLCATRVIEGAALDRRLQRFEGRDFYAYELTFADPPGAGAGHVVFGGQARTVALDGRSPVGLTRRLGFRGRLHVSGPVTVRRRPAILFSVPATRAAAGLNSGHVVVAWNEHGAAYFASVHLERLPFARRGATAAALAASVRPSG